MQIVRVIDVLGGTNGYMGVLIYAHIKPMLIFGKILESLILAK